MKTPVLSLVPGSSLPRHRPASMDLLVPYEEAKHYLAEAERIDDVLEVADRAAALKEYSRRALDTEMEAHAARIRIRAEHRAGELLKALQRTSKAEASKLAVAARSTTSPAQTWLDKSPYAQAKVDSGLSRHQALAYQALAEVPREVLDQQLELPGVVPSRAAVIRAAQPQPVESTAEVLQVAARIAAKAEKPEPVDPFVLDLWGQLQEWEQQGFFAMDPAKFRDCPDYMKPPLLKLLPVAVEFFCKVSVEVAP